MSVHISPILKLLGAYTFKSSYRVYFQIMGRNMCETSFSCWGRLKLRMFCRIVGFVFKLIYATEFRLYKSY